jgi:uncharacterized membrane protein YphA (DoxX/SURF4 family)
MSDKVKIYIMLTLRILLGCVFLFSGYMKLQSVSDFSFLFLKIEFIPEIFVPVLVYIIIIMEILVGLFLLLGLYYNIILWLTFYIICFFTFFILFVILFKLELSCQCFGILSKRQITIIDVIRNLILIGIINILHKYKSISTHYSVDNYISCIRNSQNI